MGIVGLLHCYYGLTETSNYRPCSLTRNIPLWTEVARQRQVSRLLPVDIRPNHSSTSWLRLRGSNGKLATSRHLVPDPESVSPMRGDVKERFSLRPLRETMDVVICIQPDLRSGEALYSRRASHRPRQSTVFARCFHNLMVRRLRSGSYASNPGWL